MSYQQVMVVFHIWLTDFLTSKKTSMKKHLIFSLAFLLYAAIATCTASQAGTHRKAPAHGQEMIVPPSTDYF